MILPDADVYTKHTNTVVLPHNYFAAIKHTYNKTSLVGGTSLYFHMWLLSADWNLDKLRSQPGRLHWHPAEDKSWAEKLLLVFPTTRQERTTIFSIWPKLVSSCIKDPYRFHPKVSSYSFWWGMCCFWETMLSLWSTSPTQGNRSLVPTENEKGLETSETETAFKSKSS